MSGARHTPGPWVVAGPYVEQHDLDIPLTICAIEDCGTATDANAALIAAAPAMLEALGCVEACLEVSLTCREMFGPEMYEQICAAIAQAKGETL